MVFGIGVGYWLVIVEVYKHSLSVWSGTTFGEGVILWRRGAIVCMMMDRL